MPTYEYRCASGHQFEQFQRMTEPPVEKCPICGAAAERQLSAGAGLLFKGSGFYITDYRSDSYKKAAEADSGKSTSGDGKPSSSDTKSASKPEKKADTGAKKASSGE
jgi:putative FmdB family regulatory protein